jgi:ribosomal protein S18 acetylase RimI-like enzyme
VTVGNLGSLEVSAVEFSAARPVLGWIHEKATEVELRAIEDEFQYRRRITWMPQPIQVIQDKQTIASMYFTCLPGEVAMLGGVRAVPGAEVLAAEILRSQLISLRQRLPNGLIQAAIPQADLVVQRIVESAGYQPLTAVDQLFCGLHSSQLLTPIAQSAVPDIHWLDVGQISRSRLRWLVGQTFEGTLDCPELNTIRSHEQVLQSFLMGRSLRSCPNWDLLFWNDRLCGCLLLQQHHSDLVELVYMGLAPPARGQSLGKQLIIRAKQQAARLGAAMLILAVDVRNEAAVRAYTRAGFEFYQRLQVYWIPPNTVEQAEPAVPN